MPAPVAKFIFRRWNDEKGYQTEEQQITVGNTTSGDYATFTPEAPTTTNWTPAAGDLVGVKIFDGTRVVLEVPAMEAVVSWITSIRSQQSGPLPEPKPYRPVLRELHPRRINVSNVLKFQHPSDPDSFTPQTSAVPVPPYKDPDLPTVFAPAIAIWVRVPCALGDLNLREASLHAPKRVLKDSAWVVIVLNTFDNKKLRVDRVRLVSGDYAVNPENQDFGCWHGSKTTFDLEPHPTLLPKGNFVRSQDYAMVSPKTVPAAPSSLMERVFGLHASLALVAPGAPAGQMRASWTRSDLAGQKMPWRLALRRAYNCADGLEDTWFRGEETLLMVQQAAPLDLPSRVDPAGVPFRTQGDESSWEVGIDQVLGRGNQQPHTFNVNSNSELAQRKEAAISMGTRCWKALMETWRHRLDRERDLLFYLTPRFERPALSLLPRFDCKTRNGSVTLHPRGPQLLAAGEDLEWNLELVGLRDNLGAPVTGEIKVRSARQPGSTSAPDLGARQWNADPAFHLIFDITFLKVDKDQRVRLGALDVIIEAGGVIAPQQGRVEMRFEPEVVEGVRRLKLTGFRIGHGGDIPNPGDPPKSQPQIFLILPVANIQPGGEDPLTTDDPHQPRLSPLVISHRSKGVVPLKLEIRQVALGGQRAALEMFLKLRKPQSQGSGQADRSQRVFYLHDQPFTVAMLRLQPLTTLRLPRGDLVAYWSTLESHPGWQMAATGKGFDLVWPSQGMLETMEKGRKEEGYDDFDAGQLAQAVFAPASFVAVRSSDNERHFGLVPWNLRLFLNEVRDTPMAGLPVSGGQVEMLYGLEFKWSGIPRLRLAELFSRMGDPRYRIASTPAATDFDVVENGVTKQIYYPQVAIEWEQRARQLQRRLAVHEIFDSNQPDFKASGEPGGTLLHGTFADKSSLQASLSEDALERMLTSFPLVAGGIVNPGAKRVAGGLAWAFESKTLFQALQNEPQGAPSGDRKYSAVEAHMSQLYFSALGGWGQHQAAFDEGRAIIAARIDMGRLTELRVERLGRIACAWNRAKLVTVYRRTVAPSSQFAHQQDAQYSRPVIRKVEEYIEFQEPHRLIPDAATAAVNPELAGCLKACVCHERVPVDSRWGEDVLSADGKRVIGWKVPLNRPGAGGQVYGRANMHVQFHSDPKAGQGEAAARVRCLEDVWFYTDVRPKTGADSDLWEPIYTVDFGAAHKRPAEEVPDGSGAGTAMAPAMLTQYADFTVRLEGMTRGANLVGHLRDLRTPEGDKPQLGALLHSIVWSRGSAEVEVTNAPLHDYKAGVEDALHVLEQMATRISPRDEQGVNPQRWEQVVKQLVSPVDTGKSLFNKASKALEDMRKTAGGAAEKLQAHAGTLKTLQANISWTMDRAERQILGLHGTLQQEMLEPVAKLKALLQVATVDKPKAVQAAGKLKQVWQQALADIDGTREAFDRAYTTAGADAEALEAEVDELIKKVTGASDVLGVRKIWREATEHVLHLAETKLGRATRLGWFRDLPVRVSPTALVAQLRAMLMEIGTYKASTDLAELKAVASFGLNEVKDEVFDLRVRLESLRREAGDLWQAIGERTPLEEHLRKVWQPLQDQIDALVGSGSLALAALAALEGNVKSLDTLLPNLLVQCRKQAEKLAQDLVERVSAVVLKPLEDVFREGEEMLERVQEQLLAPLGRVEGQVAEAAAIFHDCRELLGEVMGSVPRFGRDLLHSVSPKIVLKPSNALQLLRAAGDVPSVPMLDFRHITRFDELGGNIQEDVQRLAQRVRNVGYSFDEIGRRVSMTPVKAVVDRGADALGKLAEEARLKASAIESTVNELRDRATTEINELKQAIKEKGDAVREQLGLNKLTDFAKDFAGLKLEKLLGALPVSAELEQRIKKATRITQGADPKTMAAFIDTRVEDLLLDRECSLFSFGPVAMTMRNAVLNSKLRIEGKASGEVKRESWAQIRADWEMAIGGSPMVTYKDALLTCDNGRLRMELDPSKMVMAGLLQALTDLMKNVPSDDEGPFRYGLRPELPSGVTAWCRLDLPLPPLQGGTFGISGIKLGAGMDLGIRLNFLDMKKSFFTIGASLHLSEREAPFNITVFILGGCGWFALKATYKVPLGDGKPALQVYFGVSVGVSAALGINLGFASGSVFVALSLEAECTIESGNCHWRFSLALTMAGRLDILGIVSVSLLIYLAIRYETGGGLEGVGMVSVKIKICWCFTLKVQRSFTYRFGKGKQSTAAMRRPSVPGLPESSSHLWPLGVPAGSPARQYAQAPAGRAGAGYSSGHWNTAHANIV